MRCLPHGNDEPVVVPEDPNVAPTGWVSLLYALETRPENFERSRKAFREIGDGAVRYYGLIAALGMAVVTGGVLYVVAGIDGAWYPLGASDIGLPYAFGPVFAVLAYMTVSLPARMIWAFRVGNDATAPLGLQVVAFPVLVPVPWGDNTRLVGDTMLGGYRHDRRVEVASSGRHHAIGLEGMFPAFALRGDDDGRLSVHGEAPAGVAELIAAMPADRRWRGIEVDADGNGLFVRRSGGGSDARERWLEDLWLAERIAGATAAAPVPAAVA